MATRKTLWKRAQDLTDSLSPHVGSARDKAIAVSEDARVKAAPYLSDARDKAIAASADARTKATPLISDVRDKAIAASADARDKAKPYLSDARDKAVAASADARDKAASASADARGKASPYLSDARDKAAPYLSDARDKAAPYLSDARDKAQPLFSEVRDRFTDDVLPVVTAAVSAFDEATEDVRTEAVKRGRAVASAVRGELEDSQEDFTPSQDSHTVRNVLVALGLGGVVFAVVRRLSNRQPSTTWQSAYEPPPAGGMVATAAEEATADPSASDPGEFAADVTEEPHAVTTPDDPATEIDVDKR